MKWVLIRGLARDKRHWEGFAEKMQTSFPEATILTIDLPGNGENNRAQSPLKISEYVEFVRAELEKKTKLKDLNLFVVSLAGMVALEWVKRYPQEISKMVICNTSIGGVSPFYRRLNLKNLKQFSEIFLLQDMVRREKKILDITSNTRPDKVELALRWAKYNYERPVSPQNVVRQLMAASVFKIDVTKIKTPILLIASGGDKLVDFKCTFDLYKKTKWPIKIHPHAGHDVTLDAPDWTIEKIHSWIKE